MLGGFFILDRPWVERVPQSALSINFLESRIQISIQSIINVNLGVQNVEKTVGTKIFRADLSLWFLAHMRWVIKLIRKLFRHMFSKAVDIISTICSLGTFFEHFDIPVFRTDPYPITFTINRLERWNSRCYALRWWRCTNCSSFLEYVLATSCTVEFATGYQGVLTS